jgi:hemerythrin-like domain-containing protein
MQPIGPLMHEHRLIERMLALMVQEAERIEAGARPNTRFIDAAVDFYRTYADRCHHGKEEDILFRELEKKPLSEEERRIMAELVAEHVQGRALVRAVSEANAAISCRDGAAVAREIVPLLRQAAAFYPPHIAKEDKHFFFPVMRHFTRQEMDAMLAQFDDADRRLLHDKYAGLVEGLEKGD